MTSGVVGSGFQPPAYLVRSSSGSGRQGAEGRGGTVVTGPRYPRGGSSYDEYSHDYVPGDLGLGTPAQQRWRRGQSATNWRIKGSPMARSKRSASLNISL